MQMQENGEHTRTPILHLAMSIFTKRSRKCTILREGNTTGVRIWKGGIAVVTPSSYSSEIYQLRGAPQFPMLPLRLGYKGGVWLIRSLHLFICQSHPDIRTSRSPKTAIKKSTNAQYLDFIGLVATMVATWATRLLYVWYFDKSTRSREGSSSRRL